jgi:hypothetical protein
MRILSMFSLPTCATIVCRKPEQCDPSGTFFAVRGAAQNWLGRQPRGEGGSDENRLMSTEVRRPILHKCAVPVFIREGANLSFAHFKRLKATT